MILTKGEIVKAIKDGELNFTPGLDGFQLQPTGVDLRAGYNFYVPKMWSLEESGRTDLHIDHLNNEKKNEVLDCIRLKPGQTFELLPGEFILVSTLEKISMKSGKMMGMLYPRSSTARRGLLVEVGTIDPFYEGYLTIPVVNVTRTQKIKIYPGERFAHLIFSKIGKELTEEEALTHGLSKPKYQGLQSYQLEYKFDPHEEIALIKDGDVDKLKKKFEIETGETNADKDEKNQLPLSS